MRFDDIIDREMTVRREMIYNEKEKKKRKEKKRRENLGIHPKKNSQKNQSICFSSRGSFGTLVLVASSLERMGIKFLESGFSHRHCQLTLSNFVVVFVRHLFSLWAPTYAF